jgi:hypothetical protein
MTSAASVFDTNPAKGLEVLIDEDGGRREHRHLFTLEHRLESCADGDFGLSVAHVAAQQPIHRARRLHVLLDLTYRPILIRRQLELEGILELTLPRRIG